ncbi:Rieske (2Fe-2S) protein [Jatrophihabitans fulvus]
MRTPKFLTRATDAVEDAEALDAPADALAKAVGAVVRPGVVEDVLSGTPLGHPLHPLLVTVPIGAWTSALALDLTGGDADAARALVGLGVVAALPTAASGASDWLTLSGAERRVGFAHAVLNYAAVGAFGASWWVRRRNRPAGVALSAVGAAFVSVAGWLGGHLSYAQGAGVDTTVFETLPDQWADAGAVDAVPAAGELASVEVGGVPLLVTRHQGEIVVMADRCTHRGAPLHEGSIDAGCVVCPWHDSAFDLRDGAVAAGPATRPQPYLETRVHDGRLQVRKQQSRTLPVRSVGP